ncbi:MAG: hypothetical protein HY296_07680 [Thaumarchaeota archaeon]|nr:hypothetical protein [Nitrososphaerota archaeon]
MDTKRRAVVHGLGALALAVIVILSGTTFGLIRVGSPTFNPSAPASLSILLTDPPSVPAGVTAVYITYSDLEIHNVARLGGDLWIDTGASGTLETLGLVNLGETITTGDVPSGFYNLILFNISAADVEYLGQNYSAAVNGGRLIVPVVGGLELNSSNPGAAVIDIQPKVLDLGNQSDPRFVLIASASSHQVPSNDVTPEFRHIGYRVSLIGRAWFHAFVNSHPGGVSIDSVLLTPNSFSFSLSDNTSDPAGVRLVFLAPPRHGSQSTFPSGIQNSVIFLIQPNGSLTLFSVDHPLAYTPHDLRTALSEPGYLISANSTASFTFSGTILNLQKVGLTSGSSYVMTVVGNHTLVFRDVSVS